MGGPQSVGCMVGWQHEATPEATPDMTGDEEEEEEDGWGVGEHQDVFLLLQSSCAVDILTALCRYWDRVSHTRDEGEIEINTQRVGVRPQLANDLSPWIHCQ